ncbi:GMC family oxidoreductase N-terminal domain-containing protein [Streptomyces sp. NPDC002784]
MDRFTDLYRDAGATLALGSPPLVLPVGRPVGGTTVVHSGTCYRTPGHVVDRRRSRHGFAAAEEGGPDPRRPHLRGRRHRPRTAAAPRAGNPR